MRARAFWLREPGAGEIREVVLPTPRPDDVVVRTLRSAVSRGTESLVFGGRVPASQHDAMRAPFQDGDFPGPVKYGYLNVGRVEEGPADLLGRDDAFDCLLTGESSFEDLPEVMPRLVSRELPALCHSVTYPAGAEEVPCSA